MGGSLEVEGGNFGSGIGVSSGGLCGSLRILNSNVEAIGGKSCGGIGSCNGNISDPSKVNLIFIENSTIFSRGGENAAGIGSGSIGGVKKFV
jgi:hypothetical protein